MELSGGLMLDVQDLTRLRDADDKIKKHYFHEAEVKSIKLLNLLVKVYESLQGKLKSLEKIEALEKELQEKIDSYSI